MDWISFIILMFIQYFIYGDDDDDVERFALFVMLIKKISKTQNSHETKTHRYLESSYYMMSCERKSLHFLLSSSSLLIFHKLRRKIHQLSQFIHSVSVKAKKTSSCSSKSKSKMEWDDIYNTHHKRKTIQQKVVGIERARTSFMMNVSTWSCKSCNLGENKRWKKSQSFEERMYMNGVGGRKSSFFTCENLTY
jgi:hypothetical protein